MDTQNSNPIDNTPKEFSFEWNGGFSYLTYLKKKSTVKLTDQNLHISTQNFVLGAFPNRLKTIELALTNIRGLSTGLKINWFDMIFAILFVIVTILSMKFWPLVLTIIFLLRTFNTSIYITDHLGNKISIPSGSKEAATQFVQKAAQVTNQFMETASAVEHPATHTSIPQPISPTKESSKIRTIVLAASAAVVALAILFVGIYSKGGFDNKYVKWVQEGNVPGSSLTMKQVLENRTYFSNVEWQQVSRDGNKKDVNKYVMYQATYSVHGVKVSVQTIFQVFGENHFQAVETSANGEQMNLFDWNDFLIELTDKYGKPAETKATPVPTNNKETLKAAPTPAQQNVKQPVSPPATSTKGQTSNSKEFSLKSFTKWTSPEPDVTLPLILDGEKVSLRIGRDTPNGVKVQISNLTQGWNLRLPSGKSGGSAFDSFGELKKGFSLYVKEYNFDSGPAPEIVIAASDGLLETYVWVFSYNFLYSEVQSAPLELIWYGEGQSDLILDGNKILLPYGSQGLYEEYVYSNLTFEKKKK